jgi:Cytotoxic
MIPSGEPKQVLGAAHDLEGLAADMAQISGDIESLSAGVRSGPNGWGGDAGNGFADHMTGRMQVCDLAEQALARAAVAVHDYGVRLLRAQQATHTAMETASRAGLRFNGDQIDPTSLLPPDPARVAAAAAYEQQVVESELEGVWASSGLVSALQPLQQLAEDAEFLLGDRSGQTPGGFLADVARGAGGFLWTTGLGTAQLLAAVGMADLGNPQGLQEYGQGLATEAQLALEHPDQVVAGLLGLDQAGEAADSGHPGEALGIAAVALGMLLDPEGGDETDAARAASRAGRVTGRVTKATSPVWQRLKPYRGEIRTNGLSGRARRYFRWDYTHGDIEVYDGKTRTELGSLDPTTGQMIRGPQAGRKLEL